MSVENLTAAANTGQDSISSLVQMKFRKNARLAGVFTDVSSFAMEGDKSISFPKWANQFQVQKLSGSQKGDDQEALFDLDKLELTEEAHIQWAIKKFDQARAKVQILSQALEEATVQHAIGLDTDLYNLMIASLAPGNKLAGALDQDKVVDMITAMDDLLAPEEGRTFLSSTGAYGTLLKIDGFVDASKSNIEIVRTGQIGTLYGVPVVKSNAMGLGEFVLAHNRALAYGFGAQPSVEDAPVIEYGTGSRRWVMDQMYGIKDMQAEKLLVSVGIA